MAQFDSSMYRGVPAVDLSQATEGFERGMKLGDMVRQRKTQELEAQKQSAIKDAFNKSYETAPDGSQVFNPMKLKDLVRGAGYGQDAEMLAADYQKKALEQQKMNFEKEATKIKGGYQLLSLAKDQPSLEYVRRKALDIGYTQEEIDQNLPSVFDQKTIDTAKYKLGEASRSFDEMMADQRARENMAEQRADRKFNQQILIGNQNQKAYEFEKEYGIKKAKAEKDAASGENLPIDQKKIVDTLSTKVGNVSSIKNELDTFVEMWPKLSEAERLKQGDLLLKTLNSPQGADAIGVEEANRLGNKLRFAFGNITNDNPAQFGRDLEGFFDDVKNTSTRLGGTLEKNQEQIDGYLGRPKKTKQETTNQKPKKIIQNGVTYELNPQTGEYE